MSVSIPSSTIIVSSSDETGSISVKQLWNPPTIRSHKQFGAMTKVDTE